MSTPTESAAAVDVAALIAALQPMIASEISNVLKPMIASEVSNAIAAVVPPAPVPPVPAPLAAPAAIPPAFVGPLTGNQAAGASNTLLTKFPEVEEAVIIAVITHQFRASDLYKLDSKYRDKAERGVLEFENGAVRVKTDSSTKDYPTSLSIELPLMVYFRILVAHAFTTGNGVAVALPTLSYVESFLKLRSEYEWPAVLAYHMAFFARRRQEMAQGSYSGWKRIDTELQADHLAGYRKARPTASSSQAKRLGDSVPRIGEACRLFNLGSCTSPCRNGRVHKCAKCSKSDHGAHACPPAAARV